MGQIHDGAAAFVGSTTVQKTIAGSTVAAGAAGLGGWLTVLPAIASVIALAAGAIASAFIARKNYTENKKLIFELKELRRKAKED